MIIFHNHSIDISNMDVDANKGDRMKNVLLNIN